ncbi:glycosyltransferase [Methyloraptor flagellatus]|uniref:Glycosyltransferase n=1 Tax=Methyloraptor flagellatus TaxID=3162530 RepID=A0AAU7XA57_9HYPH
MFWGPFSRSPRGIDKVDLGFHRGLVRRWPGPIWSLSSTPWGLRLFTREETARHLDVLDTVWRETAEIAEDPVFWACQDWLVDRRPRPGLIRRGRDLGMIGRLAMVLKREPFQYGRPAGEIAGKALYLNVGQSTLARPDLAAWLDRQPDMRVVALIHDVIPLDNPELVPPQNVAPFWNILHMLVRYADLVLTPSETAATSVRSRLAGIGGEQIPVFSEHLPMDDTFLSAVPVPKSRFDGPFFVCCGTVEPRKNQLFLLDVWRSLVPRLGGTTPPLVLAGHCGAGGEPVVAEIVADHELRPVVLPAEGLSSTGMRGLVQQATALLMPSLAEGFGLPPVEALSVGTVPVCSDIPVLRETSQGLGIYLPAGDVVAWREAVIELTNKSAKSSVSGFVPSAWPDYVDRVVHRLMNVLASPVYRGASSNSDRLPMS